MTPSKLLRRLALAVVAAACLGCGGPRHLRVVEDDGEGRLEADWIELAPPRGRPPVLLMNMVHFGAPEFYAAAQFALDRSALVLMEGVRRSPKLAAGAAPAEAPMTRLERAFHGAAEELELTTQARALAPKPNWRGSDLTEGEITELGGPLHAYVDDAERFREALRDLALREAERLAPTLPELTPEERLSYVRRGPLRRAAAFAIVDAEVDDDVLIGRRNEAALRALDALHDVEGRVAICYGAAHGPAFERALIARGYDRAASHRMIVYAWTRRPRRAAPRRRLAA
ncbi:MAG TPA: hypothetical protein VEI02_03860 [Planctomycetota bacterium]|nr:hypothetical protein [Planctomycetota bacterium]